MVARARPVRPWLLASTRRSPLRSESRSPGGYPASSRAGRGSPSTTLFADRRRLHRRGGRPVARYGHRLLTHYRFDPVTGLWRHRTGPATAPLRLARSGRPATPLSTSRRLRPARRFSAAIPSTPGRLLASRPNGIESGAHRPAARGRDPAAIPPSPACLRALDLAIWRSVTSVGSSLCRPMVCWMDGAPADVWWTVVHANSVSLANCRRHADPVSNTCRSRVLV